MSRATGQTVAEKSGLSTQMSPRSDAPMPRLIAGKAGVRKSRDQHSRSADHRDDGSFSWARIATGGKIGGQCPPYHRSQAKMERFLIPDLT
jgi:hypothetical protein